MCTENKGGARPQQGGARPKRRHDDRRGGARVGAGAPVRRIRLDKEAAHMLRSLTMARRRSNPLLRPADVVVDLIQAAYAAAGIDDDV